MTCGVQLTLGSISQPEIHFNFCTYPLFDAVKVFNYILSLSVISTPLETVGSVL